MNNENLKNGKSTQFKSGEDAVRNAKKSAVVRRRNKSMKTAVKAVLQLKPQEAETVEMLKAYGLPDNEMTYQAAVIVAMVEKAKAGNVQAAQFLRDTIGESPTERSRTSDTKLKTDMFEYKKECDSGEAMEIEDIEDTELQIYGNPVRDPVQEQIKKER